MKLKSKNDLGSKSNLIKRLKAASSVLRSTHFSNFLQKFLKNFWNCQTHLGGSRNGCVSQGTCIQILSGGGGQTSSSFNS